MKNLTFTITLIIFTQFSFAQTIERQVINSTGNLTNNGVVKAFSNVGEPVILTFEQSTLIITQGFEQSDSNAVSGVNSYSISMINISAYPNPAMNMVVLDFKISQPVECIINIYNDLGQIIGLPLQTKIFSNCKHELNFSEFPSGNYLISVLTLEGELQKSFWVQKIE